jgi:hypothetical protein
LIEAPTPFTHAGPAPLDDLIFCHAHWQRIGCLGIIQVPIIFSKKYIMI